MPSGLCRNLDRTSATDGGYLLSSRNTQRPPRTVVLYRLEAETASSSGVSRLSCRSRVTCWIDAPCHGPSAIQLSDIPCPYSGATTPSGPIGCASIAVAAGVHHESILRPQRKYAKRKPGNVQVYRTYRYMEPLDQVIDPIIAYHTMQGYSK